MDNSTNSTVSTYGELVVSGDVWSIRFVRELPHPPARVWRALSDPDELAAWFPSTIDGERQTGAALTFHFRDNEAPDLEGVMIAYEPPSLLEFWWGDDRLRIELEPTPQGTRLTLYDTVLEHGKAARDGAGWHVCLDSLERSLDDAAAGDQTTWRAVQPYYVETFGPAASTIGPPEGMG